MSKEIKTAAAGRPSWSVYVVPVVAFACSVAFVDHMATQVQNNLLNGRSAHDRAAMHGAMVTAAVQPVAPQASPQPARAARPVGPIDPTLESTFALVSR